MTDDAKVVSVVSISTPSDNIIAGSTLAQSLDLTGDTVTFALTSKEPRKIIQLDGVETEGKISGVLTPQAHKKNPIAWIEAGLDRHNGKLVREMSSLSAAVGVDKVGQWGKDTLVPVAVAGYETAIDAGQMTVDVIKEGIKGGVNGARAAINGVMLTNPFTLPLAIDGLVYYEVEPNSEWLKYINQDSNMTLWNGIGSTMPEGDITGEQGRLKEYFTPIPMHERYTRGMDALIWSIDEVLGIDILTNEMRVKTNAYLDRINEDVRERGITDLAYSGSFNPKVKNLRIATEENKDIKALVGVGAVSIRGSWFTQKMNNPNLGVLVNTWGDKDIFYSGALKFLKLVGPKRFEGVPYYNVMILGADHGDYLNNDNATDDRSRKITTFVRELTKTASIGEDDVREYLHEEIRKGSITFNKSTGIYIVDPNKLSQGYLR